MSDLREERGRGGCAQASQMNGQQLLFSGPRDDLQYQDSNLKEDGETDERFGNSRFGESQATGAEDGRDGMARGDREIAGGGGLKERGERAQAQDLGLDRNLNGRWGVGRDGSRGGPEV